MYTTAKFKPTGHRRPVHRPREYEQGEYAEGEVELLKTYKDFEEYLDEDLSAGGQVLHLDDGGVVTHRLAGCSLTELEADGFYVCLDIRHNYVLKEHFGSDKGKFYLFNPCKIGLRIYFDGKCVTSDGYSEIIEPDDYDHPLLNDDGKIAPGVYEYILERSNLIPAAFQVLSYGRMSLEADYTDKTTPYLLASEIGQEISIEELRKTHFTILNVDIAERKKYGI